MFERVGIVGVGLIGASIGLALKQRRLSSNVVGIGRSPENLRLAQSLGAIDEYRLGIDQTPGDVELVVVCTPVDRIIDHLCQLAEQVSPECLLTDAGSTKEAIVAGVTERLGPSARFIGSHPLAGSEQRGCQAGTAGLFENKVCVITPIDSTAAKVVRGAQEFWESLGMRVLALPPAEHDQILARTSHLPHLLSTALALTLREGDADFAASGFRDMARLAAGDPQLWTAIFSHNASHLVSALDGYQRQLAELRQLLQDQDFAQLTGKLQHGKNVRDKLGN